MLEKIKESELSETLLARLPLRPAAESRYGTSPMTGEEIRAAFDKSPILLANRLNEVIDEVNGTRSFAEEKVDILTDTATRALTLADSAHSTAERVEGALAEVNEKAESALAAAELLHGYASIVYVDHEIERVDDAAARAFYRADDAYSTAIGVGEALENYYAETSYVDEKVGAVDEKAERALAATDLIQDYASTDYVDSEIARVDNAATHAFYHADEALSTALNIGEALDNFYATTRYVDIEVSAVNKKTERALALAGESEGALGPDARAEGRDTSAGVRGYYFAQIDATGEAPVITLTGTQGVIPDAPFSVGYELGDKITLINGSRYDRAATVTAIQENKLTLDALPFAVEGVVKYGTGDADDFSLYVTEKASVGLVPLGIGAHAEGDGTAAYEWASHAEGRKTRAYGQFSHAEGADTQALGDKSHAEGSLSEALGAHAHAEGASTKAKGDIAHAEGYKTEALGFCSHTEGNGCKATGGTAHAEGIATSAAGNGAHAEGNASKADGENAHAEGKECNALGNYSHAGGLLSSAYGNASFAHGTALNARAGQTVFGQYNSENSNASLIVGGGTNEQDRMNLMTVMKDGRVKIASAPIEPDDAVSKDYVDSKVGLIEQALDEIIAMQEALVGGTV